MVKSDALMTRVHGLAARLAGTELPGEFGQCAVPPTRREEVRVVSDGVAQQCRR